MAESPEALEAWIAQTADLREKLTNGGYGSEFSASDLFPLFQGFVAKAMTAKPSRSGTAGPARWLWIGAIVGAIIVGVILALTIAS